MKLKNLMYEVINDSTYESMLNECSFAIESFKKNVGFYRGLSGTLRIDDIQKIEARQRKAKDTNNFANVLIDYFNPEQQKRTYCTIFTNSYDIAKSYGDVHYVFPVDSSKITYGQDSDNYTNYRNGFGVLNSVIRSTKITDIEEFNALIWNLLKDSGKYNILDITSIDDSLDSGKLINAIDESFTTVKNMIQNTDASSITSKMVYEFVSATQIEHLYEVLKMVFSPTLNNIKTIEFKSYPTISKNIEIWTESPVYILNQRSKYVKMISPQKGVLDDEDDGYFS